MNDSDDSSRLSNRKINRESKKNKPTSLVSLISNLFTSTPQNREQLSNLLKDTHKKEIISLESLNMIEGVLKVSDQQVRDIMIPRSQMIVIEKDQNLEDFLPKMIESGHSRFPVMGENRDEVLGIILSKDLLPSILKPQEKINLKDLLRPAMIIPESKRLNILLKEFKDNKQHMAIIADEYGGISGLVTIEDVLEQIVGEIEDEFDTEDDSYIIEHQDKIYHVQALTPIEDFNEYFNSSFSDEEFDTIGGLVLNAIGHLPKKGEDIEINGFKVKILSADKRRIKLLQVIASNENKPSDNIESENN